jgi:hypothetical protein
VGKRKQFMKQKKNKVLQYGIVFRGPELSGDQKIDSKKLISPDFSLGFCTVLLFIGFYLFIPTLLC